MSGERTSCWRIELSAVRRPDYADREARCPARYTPCLLCGVPMIKPWPHVVQLVDDGCYIVPEDAPTDVTDPGYVGCWPVGSCCWQRLMAAVKAQAAVASGSTYTCAHCGGTFERAEEWTDEDAAAECRDVFGCSPGPDGGVVVCDDCYRKLLARAEHVMPGVRTDRARLQPQPPADDEDNGDTKE